jgi:hypothetical protein
MLRFFRQIRQRLLTENRFSKYLLYAIGEILLVVIGILIALQVNNWNEKQKDRAKGFNYLERILSDVKKDTAILNNKNNLADRLSAQYLDMILEMHKTQESKEDFIRLMNSVEFNVDELILTDVAYSELVNTGNMSLIFNNALKDQISDYYRSYDFISERVRELNQSNLNTIHASSVAAPTLKYWVKGYMDTFSDEIFEEAEYMFNDSDWAFINNPRSLEFRLLEEAVYYYYAKQVLLKPMYGNLNAQAVALIRSLQINLHDP